MYSSQLSNFQILALVMPSENESDLAKCLSDLKEELRSGFSSLKRELVEENSFAECQAEGTLIVPEWVSSPFWPMLFGPQSLYSSLVKCTIINYHFFNVHIMNVNYAKFQKKFDRRTISKELP